VQLTLAHANVDLETGELRRGEVVEQLRDMERRLLQRLASRPGAVVTRAELLTEVWGYSERATTRTLDSTVRRLRKRIEPDPSDPRHILTVRGVGYRFSPASPKRPQSTRSFVGREDDLARLNERHTSHKLVTVVGLGGMGKTSLVFRYLESVADNIVFVVLHGCSTSTGLCQRLADALEMPRSVDLHRTSHALLAQAPLTLVLDGCEGVGPALGSWLGTFLPTAEGIRAIATSRKRLDTPSEVVLRLAPLPEQDAVRLLQQRAEACGATQLDPKLLAPLARRLDGIPLAIELAAARLDMLSVDEMMDRLQERFVLLDRPGRPTLHGTLVWAWEQLSDAERNALLASQAFAGPFGMRAWEAIVAQPHALDLAQSLFRRSLLAKLPGAPTRFRLLDVVRSFLRSLVPESNQLASAQHAHARHMAQRARPFLDTPVPLIGPSPELATMMPDLSAACAHAIRADMPTEAAFTALALCPVMLSSHIGVVPGTRSAVDALTRQYPAFIPEKAKAPAASVWTATVSWSS
jgi:predicted ATPase